MMDVETTDEDVCALYFDMGTTNTRGWLMRGSDVIARADKAAGVRDSAREGSPVRIRTALKELITELQAQGTNALNRCTPMCLAAAGMISSRLGLVELAHVPAPAGLEELVEGSRWFEFPEITDLPILLVPGVRSEPTTATRNFDRGLDFVKDMDVMRGEETLCIGLITSGLVKPPVVVLNLGSHWKAIQVGAAGQIGSSITSLSGELIHVTQTQTILANSVGKQRASEISEEWKDAGMKEERRSGLPRALFCARLLELANEGKSADRLAFLIGAFIAADLDALMSRRALSPDIQVVIIGAAAMAGAWRNALIGMSVPAIALTPSEAEAALLSGLGCILVRARQQRARRT